MTVYRLSLKTERKLGPWEKLASLGCAPGHYVNGGITTKMENMWSENRFVENDGDLRLGYPGGCGIHGPKTWERHLGRRVTRRTFLSQMTVKLSDVYSQCRGYGLEGAPRMPLFWKAQMEGKKADSWRRIRSARKLEGKPELHGSPETRRGVSFKKERVANWVEC